MILRDKRKTQQKKLVYDKPQLSNRCWKCKPIGAKESKNTSKTQRPTCWHNQRFNKIQIKSTPNILKAWYIHRSPGTYSCFPSVYCFSLFSIDLEWLSIHIGINLPLLPEIPVLGMFHKDPSATKMTLAKCAFLLDSQYPKIQNYLDVPRQRQTDHKRDRQTERPWNKKILKWCLYDVSIK